MQRTEDVPGTRYTARTQDAKRTRVYEGLAPPFEDCLWPWGAPSAHSLNAAKQKYELSFYHIENLFTDVLYR